MDIQLQFVRSCVRAAISPDDVGYMMATYFATVSDKDPKTSFFNDIIGRMHIWDQPKRITGILENYKISIK